MYTQCPDCSIAFRVTAEVLKQAAGQVRCGGCGNAFNALAFLSEEMPDRATIGPTNADMPALSADKPESSDGPPQTISAEQSAALLKTLDELAGSDIRIEDTGVEWRVFDEDDEAGSPASNEASGLYADASHIDELLDDAETPLDEFLTATPEVVDAPEVFSAAANGLAKTPVDELRFDDNTPLPDDFDLGDEASFIPVAEPDDDPDDEAESFEAAFEHAAVDIELTEPEEWDDILDEFDDISADDDVIDGSESDDSESDDSESDDSIVLEVDDEDDAEEIVLEDPDNTGIEELAEDDSANQPLDTDTQFALQAEAMGIDLSGMHEVPDDAFVAELDEELGEELDEGLDDDPDDVRAEDTEESPDESPDEELVDEIEDEAHASISDSQQLFQLLPDDELADEDELDEVELDEVELEENLLDDDLPDEGQELIAEPVVDNHQIENELSMLDGDASPDQTDDDASGEHYVPPLTEEEQTVNMQIDQDLMALAIQDEDGFASTIIIPDADAEAALAGDFENDDVDADADEDRPGFETIIMEGEFIRSELDAEKLAADAAAAAELAAIARQKEAEQEKKSGGIRWGMVGGAIVLAVLLGLQFMHQSREALATNAVFSNTVGKIYRAVGSPIQPAWDITGWRIEASNDRVDVEDSGENLTVEIRIGNNSDAPLPYPLVSISLTDRFLESVGNRMLDPAQYLQDGVDPRKLVEPGETFRALASIKSPSIAASGYKVDVCYRNTDGRLRCAIDDFK